MSDLAEALDPVQAIERGELDAAFRHLAADPRGKRVLFWMLEQCAIYQDAYSGENNATNYRLGLQAAGRRLIDQMNAVDPRLYPALLLDMAEIRELDRAAAAARDDTTESDDEDAA